MHPPATCKEVTSVLSISLQALYKKREREGGRKGSNGEKREGKGGLFETGWMQLGGGGSQSPGG